MINRLRFERENKLLTIRELAALAGVGEGTIYGIEGKGRSASLPTRRKLMTAMEIPFKEHIRVFGPVFHARGKKARKTIGPAEERKGSCNGDCGRVEDAAGNQIHYSPCPMADQAPMISSDPSSASAEELMTLSEPAGQSEER